MRRLLLSTVLLIMLCARAQAQVPAYTRHHEIGLSAGLANYYGDLQPKVFASSGYAPMVGIVYKYFMTPRVGIRAGFAFTNLSAADSLSPIPNNKLRNLSFATNLLEFHSALEFNFLPIEVLKMKATPYIFGGIGLFYFNPYAEDNTGTKRFLRALSTEGQGLPMYPDRKPYSLANMCFPFGGGFKFFIGQTLMVTPEIGFRYTNTDYLDDVSKTYVNLDTIQAYKGTLAREMSFRGNTVSGWDNNNPKNGFQRGDPKANDWYWFTNVTVTVFFRAFGNPREYLKTKCPRFFYR